MTTHRIRTAEERRRDIQAQAARLGIDDAYISTLVDSFYSRIRADATLGPIFQDAIGDRWDQHMPRMKNFWASVAMNAGRYNGKPIPAHVKLNAVQREHFDIWLGLFRQTLEDTAPTPGAVPYFMERAERIADSLRFAMFGLPNLPRPDFWDTAAGG
ncbi:MAG: group III truncated hemoglobin [Alphaproteobacteria bacterium]